MSNHAFLSPSSSHRWLNCTPSAKLESEYENKTSQAAEEGTAAHAQCEHKLKKALRRRSKRPMESLLVVAVLQWMTLVQRKMTISYLNLNEPLNFWQAVEEYSLPSVLLWKEVRM